MPMRPRFLAVALAGAALVVLAPQTAWAQYSGRYMGRADNPVGPTVSPYLNLVGNQLGGVTNYQSLVRPLISQDRALQYQGNSINYLQRQAAQQGASQRATGHASFFMNYMHYYPQAQGRR
jgi:hypothetical protein